MISVKSIKDAKYVYNLALLANMPAQAKSLLLSEEKAARSIDIYMKTKKIEFMSFKRQWATTILSARPLKLVD